MGKGLRIAGLLVVLTSWNWCDAAAQVIRGSLLEEGSGRPLAQAMVILLDEGGQQIAGSLTNDDGRFTITAPAPGRYRLRAERIGHGSTQSELFSALAGQMVEQRLTAPIQVISLQGIVATGSRRCESRPAEGLHTQMVWEEARKALTATTLLRDPALSFRLAEFDREIDPVTRRVRRQRTRTAVRATSSPYVSAAPEDLSRGGYVQAEGDSLIYFAPDAEHLLSDGFLDTHCFHVVVGRGERAGQIGLAFQPVRGTRLPGIAGTLWLDQETAHLADVEYRYTSLRLPQGARSSDAGGSLTFERLPSGAWIVQRWNIRMPEVGQTTAEAAPEQIRAGARLERVAAIREQGGEVVEIMGMLATNRTGRIAGSVRDERSGSPVTGVTVFLDGTGFFTETGSDGTFTLQGVPPGRYVLSYFHPALAARGVPGESVPVTVTAHDPAALSLVMNGNWIGRGALAVCGEIPPGTGGVAGSVSDAATSRRVGAADVEFRWSRFELGEIVLRERWESEAVTADSEGNYAACELPSDRTVRARARHGARLSPEAVLKLTAGSVMEHNFIIGTAASR